ncbi:MAG TPA: hypothetical protein VJ873_10650 [bacterium]|nr:hypothetical protein [bacterium]
MNIFRQENLLSYQLIIEQKIHHLYVTAFGENSAKTMASYLEQVFGICKEKGVRRLLLVENLEGTPWDPLEAYKAASKKALETRGDLEAIAFVDVNASPERLELFAGPAATGPEFRVKSFAIISEAEEWIQK